MVCDDGSRLEIEYHSDWVDCENPSELIQYFQNIEDRLNSQNDIIEHWMEFSFDLDNIRLEIYIKRRETETERIQRENHKQSMDSQVEEKERDRLKELMDKYPKAVFDWIQKK